VKFSIFDFGFSNEAGKIFSLKIEDIHLRFEFGFKMKCAEFDSEKAFIEA